MQFGLQSLAEGPKPYSTLPEPAGRWPKAAKATKKPASKRIVKDDG
jgi:hypothetical protein